MIVISHHSDWRAYWAGTVYMKNFTSPAASELERSTAIAVGVSKYALPLDSSWWSHFTHVDFIVVPANYEGTIWQYGFLGDPQDVPASQSAPQPYIAARMTLQAALTRTHSWPLKEFDEMPDFPIQFTFGKTDCKGETLCKNPPLSPDTEYRCGPYASSFHVFFRALLLIWIISDTF